MGVATHPGETDLLLPLPADGEQWDPYTVHTHYFGFSVPEAGIGAYVYLRYQPAFPLAQGGVGIFHGLDNHDVLDNAFVDYGMTLPWPEIDGSTIRLANGLEVEFVVPGEHVRLRYTSRDGQTSFDLEQRAVTPLFVRGHIMPGEEDHHGDPSRAPGGSEQFLRCTGELVLHGERHAVDCLAVRDRSWMQVRGEDQGGARPVPPIGWTPMAFGDDLAFNQVGFEAPDTDPLWKGVYDIPEGAPTHHFAWLYAGGEPIAVTKVRRAVHERHPRSGVVLRQTVEAVDERGVEHRFEGRAVAAAAMPAWANIAFHDVLFRWEDQQGRVCHQTFQEVWYDRFQQVVKQHRP